MTIGSMTTTITATTTAAQQLNTTQNASKLCSLYVNWKIAFASFVMWAQCVTWTIIAHRYGNFHKRFIFFAFVCAVGFSSAHYTFTRMNFNDIFVGWTANRIILSGIEYAAQFIAKWIIVKSTKKKHSSNRIIREKTFKLISIWYILAQEINDTFLLFASW